MDIENMPYEAMVAAKKKLEAALDAKREEAITELRAEITALIERRGFSISEVLPGFVVSKRRPSSEVRYRHPGNADLTWAGKGKKPNWLKEFEAGGGNIETCRV